MAMKIKIYIIVSLIAFIVSNCGNQTVPLSKGATVTLNYGNFPHYTNSVSGLMISGKAGFLYEVNGAPLTFWTTYLSNNGGSGWALSFVSSQTQGYYYYSKCRPDLIWALYSNNATFPWNLPVYTNSVTTLLTNYPKSRLHPNDPENQEDNFLQFQVPEKDTYSVNFRVVEYTSVSPSPASWYLNSSTLQPPIAPAPITDGFLAQKFLNFSSGVIPNINFHVVFQQIPGSTFSFFPWL